MKKLDILKTGLSLLVSVGVGAVVGNAIKATTPETTKGIGKLLVTLGSLALTGIASDMASRYTETKIDEAADAVREAVTEEDEEEPIEDETEE